MMSFPTAFQLPWSPAHSGAVLRLLADCLDISAVWSIGHEPDESTPGLGHIRLLAFADPATLARLRRSQYLHSPDVEFLVLVDGDAFASAGGPATCRARLRAGPSGKRPRAKPTTTSPAGPAMTEPFMRVRRKAFLIWERLVAR
jgi:hypothetical protein